MAYLNSKHSLILGRFMFLVMVWLLAACTSQDDVVTIEATRPSATPTHTPTVTQTPIAIATAVPTHIPTATRAPTLAPTPTTTPFPTVTPPPTIATKTVFLQYGSVGGDGGSDTDLYYGRNMPSLVIYTDGQVILQEGAWDESYFLEATISSDEMCNLLSQLQSFGFFEIYNPIYAFDETTQYSDGGSEGIVHINGPLPKRLMYYWHYRDYLIPPLKQSYVFISNYRPSIDAYYLPERLVLWVESAPETLPENAVVELWPDTLPNITVLWQDPINGEVAIEGEIVAPIMELFDYRMTSEWFSDEGVTYKVILRPLLPNETPYPQLRYYYDYNPQSFNLPFACPNLELSTIAPTRTPSPPPVPEPIAELTGKGRILFDSRRNGNSEIYVMNADGTNVLNLTNHLAKDEMAVWSPDGQKIVFVSNRDGNDELYLMNLDGTNVTRLTHSAAREMSPAWSPDGKKVIFISNRLGDWRNEKWQLFAIDIETGVESQFTNTLVEEGMFSPDWSPDGEKILFSSGYRETSQIFVIDKNGENQELLRAGTGAVWSPDGQYIAFFEANDNGDRQIFVMNADGANVRQITKNARFTTGLVWSPDGAYLLFTSYHKGLGEGEIYVVSAAEKAEPIQVTFNFSEDYSSDWSP